jgi:hypothetical protein
LAVQLGSHGFRQALSIIDVGISLARGHEVSALDIASIAVPSLKLAKLGAKATKLIQGAVRAAERIEDNIETGLAIYENRQQISAFGNALAAGDLQGAWAAGGSVVTQMALPLTVKALGVRHSPCQGRVIWNLSANQASCFAAGTPIKLPDGSSKPIEEFQVGDAILTKPEHDSDAATRAGIVVALFKRPAPIINLHVGSGIIETTDEHPFYVKDFGWKNAVELRTGDELMTSSGGWIRCDGIANSGQVKTVYNVEVADCHTYFVGDTVWGFDLWAHNYKDAAGRVMSPRAARRMAMREAGIPTSQQPTSQRSVRSSCQPAGRQYTYNVDGRAYSVQHSLTDRVKGHTPHWEAGATKVGGQLDSVGRPRLQSDKIKIDEFLGAHI